MSDLLIELHDLRRGMNQALRIAKERGMDLAEKEATYKVAKAKLVLCEREKKTPVSVINDIVLGDPMISELRQERDIAKVLYINAQEAINVRKLELRIVEAQLGREWNEVK
ncbi:hypothetical protein [Veillonella sp. VA142]|uniref:hypothetical protein n=1 Tax=Veillonella sp. VA142 TaxID=741834 RepID=UPI000F8C98DF|nr:hypothetical protein [Veillonella sp. VA142]